MALFAVFNLVAWIAVAIGVGVLVTPTLDLGVESFIRSQQATAVVAWSRISLPRASTTVAPKPAAVAASSATRATSLPAALPPTKAAAAGPSTRTQPSPAATRSVQSTPSSVVAEEAPQVVASDPGAENPVTTPTPRLSTATPEPAQALSSDPLLIADADMDTMALIDDEMARSAAGRPVEIRYDEETLNRQVSAALANTPDLPYENVQLDLQHDQVEVEGTVTVMGLRVDATVVGTVVAQDCTPQVEISSISIAGILTPGFVRDAIEKSVLDSLSWYPADSPLCVEGIVMEEDYVTIYGSRR
jgi:hypothetical protein